MFWGNCFLTFRRKVPPSSSGLWRFVGKELSNHTAQNLKHHFHQPWSGEDLKSRKSRYKQGQKHLNWWVTIRFRGSLCSVEFIVTLCSPHQVVSTNLNYVTFVRYNTCFEQLTYVQYLYETTFRAGYVAMCLISVHTLHLFLLQTMDLWLLNRNIYCLLSCVQSPCFCCLFYKKLHVRYGAVHILHDILSRENSRFCMWGH